MEDWKEEEIQRLERERDRNLSIHCERVAAKYQRMIDKLKDTIENRGIPQTEQPGNPGKQT